MSHVRSEAVRRISWDEDTRTLFVQFVSGETYAYLDVPPAPTATSSPPTPSGATSRRTSETATPIAASRQPG